MEFYRTALASVGINSDNVEREVIHDSPNSINPLSAGKSILNDPSSLDCHPSSTGTSAAPYFAGDKFELAPGETKTRSGSHKVVCPHRPAGQNTFTYVAMKGHVETKHPAHFGAMFGAPVPKSACPECGVYFPSKHLADHLLKAHGSVPLKDRKNTQVLKRMKESVLLDLLATEGRAQNTLKKRIRAGCSRLREHGSARLKDRLMGAYGLDVTKVWPTDASGAGEEIKGLIGAGKGQPKTGGEATRLWLAQQLALLRDEAGQKFRLADGEIGGYREVADEIEDILVRASLAR